MSKIYKTTDDFPFHELTIGKPVSAPGGNFFIRYSMNEMPLYVQPPKCLVKQVLNKTGKRMYCDFVFQQENEQFIRWMENLENKSQQLLFKNKNQWFETDLDIQDIEDSFTSPLKIYKSGKSYIVRSNIQSRNGRPIVKIYDEDEQDILLDQIHENMSVMVILEIQGIRCSQRSFQIDIELKQMMVLKPDDLFDTCILKSRKDSKTEDLGNELPSVPLLVSSSSINTPSCSQPIAGISVITAVPGVSSQVVSSPTVEVDLFEPKPQYEHHKSVSSPTSSPTSEPISEPTSEPMESKNVTAESTMESESNETIQSVDTPAQESCDSVAATISSIPEESIELREVDFDLEEMSEMDTISIKQRKDVYYEMYREALRKAKVAKDLALSAYLEAKHIKNKYMLDDISDEDEESMEEEYEEELNENENHNQGSQGNQENQD